MDSNWSRNVRDLVQPALILASNAGCEKGRGPRWSALANVVRLSIEGHYRLCALNALRISQPVADHTPSWPMMCASAVCSALIRWGWPVIQGWIRPAKPHLGEVRPGEFHSAELGSNMSPLDPQIPEQPVEDFLKRAMV